MVPIASCEIYLFIFGVIVVFEEEKISFKMHHLLASEGKSLMLLIEILPSF